VIRYSLTLTLGACSITGISLNNQRRGEYDEDRGDRKGANKVSYTLLPNVYLLQIFGNHGNDIALIWCYITLTLSKESR